MRGAATSLGRFSPAAAPKFLTPIQVRLLSDKTRAAIDEAVGSAPVVLFMKGTPETPQCGFSRAAIQILGRDLEEEKILSIAQIVADAKKEYQAKQA